MGDSVPRPTMSNQISTANVPCPYEIESISNGFQGKWLGIRQVKFIDPRTRKTDVWECVYRTTTKADSEDGSVDDGCVVVDDNSSDNMSSPPKHVTDGVEVIPILRKHGEQYLVLVKQYRMPARGWTLEFPAGLIDPGETSEEAGVRELLEETGYTADRIIASTAGSTSPLLMNPDMSNDTVHYVQVTIDGEAEVNQNAAPEEGEFEVGMKVILLKLSDHDTLAEVQRMAEAETLMIEAQLLVILPLEALKFLRTAMECAKNLSPPECCLSSNDKDKDETKNKSHGYTHCPYEVIGEDVPFRGRWLGLRQIHFIDPTSKERGVWQCAFRTTRPATSPVDGVDIIPLLTSKRLVDPNETVENCGLRELKEETGYTATKVLLSGPSPGKQMLDPGLTNDSVKFLTVEVDADVDANQNPKQELADGEVDMEVLIIPVCQLLSKCKQLTAEGVYVEAMVYTFALAWELAKSF